MILLSLQSSNGLSGALGLLDPVKGLRYLQVEKKSSLVNSYQLRGIELIDDRLYVLTQASLKIYGVNNKRGEPAFRLNKEIIFHEWLTGKNMQANLLPLMVSAERKRIYIGNNNQTSIDELDMDGELLERHYLWDINPYLFPLPRSARPNFEFAHIRSIIRTPDDKIIIVAANVNNTINGAVFELESGNVLLSNIYSPSGGEFRGDDFFLIDVRQGSLGKYKYNQNTLSIDSTTTWTVKPAITKKEYINSTQHMRGMCIKNNKIYCGVCNFGKSQENQIPPRIVVFDAISGKQLNEIEFPYLARFRKPRVYFMRSVMEELFSLEESSLTYFNSGKLQQFKEPSIDKISDLNNQTDELYIKKNEIEAEEELDEDNSEGACYLDSEPYDIDEQEVIQVREVSLFYYRTGNSIFSRKKEQRKGKSTWALKNISFSVREGEVLGIIGRNGSGKSTLGMLLTGTLSPDIGKILTQGKVQLLSLNVGFRNELSGRENIYISGTLLGLSRASITGEIENIAEFSELKEFLDEPVRTYSSGMRSRLAFAIATAVNPDILILDEVMSTGDQSFHNKANDRMHAMRKNAKTVIIVSHSSGELRKLCTRVIWLDKGKIIMDGRPRTVLTEYKNFSQNTDEWLKKNYPEYLTENSGLPVNEI